MTLLLASSAAAVAVSLLLAWYMAPFVVRTVRFEPRHLERDMIIISLGAYWLHGLGVSVAFLVRHFAGAPGGWYMPGILASLQGVLIFAGLGVLAMMRMGR